IIISIIGVIIFIFAKYFTMMFVQDVEAVNFATNYLLIMAFCFPFLGINFVLNGIVRASGAMYHVLVLNIISFWVLIYPLASFFAKIYGDKGIPIGLGTSLIISSLIAAAYYRYGGWRSKDLFSRERK